MSDPELRRLTDEFGERLRKLRERGHLRHGLAGMALAMQQELVLDSQRGAVANSSSLELLMRGIYTSLCGTGNFDHHPVEKITLGYIYLMCDLQPARRTELADAFRQFKTVLKNRD